MLALGCVRLPHRIPKKHQQRPLWKKSYHLFPLAFLMSTSLTPPLMFELLPSFSKIVRKLANSKYNLINIREVNFLIFLGKCSQSQWYINMYEDIYVRHISQVWSRRKREVLFLENYYSRYLFFSLLFFFFLVIIFIIFERAFDVEIKIIPHATLKLIFNVF